MRKTFTFATIGLASAVTLGLVAFTGPVSAADDDAAFQRKDDNPDVVMAIDDDDDDDTFARDGQTRTRTQAQTRTRTRGDHTGVSRSTRDHTNSRVTAVSRDRDLSRSDLTRDRTADGPGRNNRDLTADTTNDRSRNDTRARRA